jgi:uncharacterized protein
MRILLPIAAIGVHVWLIVAIGSVIGLLSGLLGIGGGFLLTPILMMIGVPPTVAAASSTNAIVATSSSGVAAHFRLHNVDFQMGSILLLGGLAGSGMGVRAIYLLRKIGHVNLFITLTYIFILGFVGSYIVRDSWRKMRSGKVAIGEDQPPHTMAFLRNLPLQMLFPYSHVQQSVLVPFALGVFVGLLTSVMGMTGGFLLVPMMVYLLRMPTHVAVGTSLFQILFTCAAATLMQASANHTVDLVLALLVAVGSTIGAQIGAHLSGLLRGEQLMILLGILVLGIAATLAVSRVLPPSVSLSRIAKLELTRPLRQLCVVLRFAM